MCSQAAKGYRLGSPRWNSKLVNWTFDLTQEFDAAQSEFSQATGFLVQLSPDRSLYYRSSTESECGSLV